MRRLFEEALRQETPLLMSAVNWGEVFYLVLQKRGELAAKLIDVEVQDLPLTILAVDRERATRAAKIKQKHHLGYADSFAAELAIERDAWLVTADPDFTKLGKLLKGYFLPRHTN